MVSIYLSYLEEKRWIYHVNLHYPRGNRAPFFYRMIKALAFHSTILQACSDSYANHTIRRVSPRATVCETYIFVLRASPRSILFFPPSSHLYTCILRCARVKRYLRLSRALKSSALHCASLTRCKPHTANTPQFPGFRCYLYP